MTPDPQDGALRLQFLVEDLQQLTGADGVLVIVIRDRSGFSGAKVACRDHAAAADLAHVIEKRSGDIVAFLRSHEPVQP